MSGGGKDATHGKSASSSKGQITLPKALREALGLTESSMVEFELRDGEAVLKPAPRDFFSYFGSVEPADVLR